MSTTQHPESEWLDKVLTDFRSSTIIIHAQGSVRGPEEDRRAFQQSLDEAKSQIEAKLKSAEIEGRIDEQQRYLKMLKIGSWRSFGTEVTERLADLEAQLEGINANKS